MARRTLLLVAAVLLAAIGTGVLFFYVRATSGTGQSTGGTVAVLAPEVTIGSGTKIKNQRFVTVQMARASVQSGAYVTNIAQIRGKVATRELPANVAISLEQFKGTVQATTDLAVGPGLMALTVEVEDPNRVSSFLTQGQDVALFVVDPSSKQNAGHEARLLLPKVRVLTTGTSGTIIEDNGQAAGANANRGAQALVTFEVDQSQAGTILVARAAGEIYLALLGPNPTASPKAYNEACLVPGATC